MHHHDPGRLAAVEMGGDRRLGHREPLEAGRGAAGLLQHAPLGCSQGDRVGTLQDLDVGKRTGRAGPGRVGGGP